MSIPYVSKLGANAEKHNLGNNTILMGKKSLEYFSLCIQATDWLIMAHRFHLAFTKENFCNLPG